MAINQVAEESDIWLLTLAEQGVDFSRVIDAVAGFFSRETAQFALAGTLKLPASRKSSMRSRAPSDKLDLERDLPTTAEDTEALRRARTARALGLEDYLRFLAQLPAPAPNELRARSGPRADHPFELP